MQKLLSIEWYKIRYYKTFWILLGLTVVGMVGFNLWLYNLHVNVHDQAGSQNADIILGHPYSYPDIWETVSFWSGFLLFLPGLIIITLLTNEYTFKTHRQNIIDGWTRLQFISVKLVWVLILSLISTVVVLLMVLIFGARGGVSFSLTNVKFLAYFFLEAVSYLTVALLLSVWLKKAGLSIAIFFVYIIILKKSIAALLDYLTHGNSGEYLPLQSADALLPIPFAKSLTKHILQAPPPETTLIIVSLLYLGIIVYVVVGAFQKSDL